MVGTKSRGYSNLGQLSEGKYSMPFFVFVPAIVLVSNSAELAEV